MTHSILRTVLCVGLLALLPSLAFADGVNSQGNTLPIGAGGVTVMTVNSNGTVIVNGVETANSYAIPGVTGRLDNAGMNTLTNLKTLSCPTGAVVTTASTGLYTCVALPAVPAPPNCGDSQYLTYANGAYACKDLPTVTPPAVVACSANPPNSQAIAWSGSAIDNNNTYPLTTVPPGYAIRVSFSAGNGQAYNFSNNINGVGSNMSPVSANPWPSVGNFSGAASYASNKMSYTTAVYRVGMSGDRYVYWTGYYCP